jgi:hypothetical protein
MTNGKRSVSDALWDFTERVLYFVVPIVMLMITAIFILGFIVFVVLLITAFL